MGNRFFYSIKYYGEFRKKNDAVGVLREFFHIKFPIKSRKYLNQYICFKSKFEIKGYKLNSNLLNLKRQD